MNQANHAPEQAPEGAPEYASIEAAGAPNSADPLGALDGEPGIPNVAQASGARWSRKAVAASVLTLVTLLGMSGILIHRAFSSPAKEEDAASKRASDRPSASAISPRTLEVGTAPSARASEARATVIPAIAPLGDDSAQPIAVRRTNGSQQGRHVVAPEDAPVLLIASRLQARERSPDSPDAMPAAHPASPAADQPDDALKATQRNLQGYQRQLQGMLDTLAQGTALATCGRSPRPPAAAMEAPAQALAALGGAPGAGLFGGQLQGSATPRVAASTLGDRSLTLPKGTAFTCALKTKVISAASGLVGCQVQRNVYGDNGRVLLIERGSHLDGEYRIGAVRPGMVRIPVLWTRIRTPNGITVDVDSPGTGPLGESGIDGYVDNRWVERIGAAMLLSLIEDAVQVTLQNQSSETQADTLVLPSTTSSTSRLAEKVLDSTINIPPLIYQNQGGIVGIYVARDVDFSSVYALEASAR